MTVEENKHLELESPYLDDYRNAIRSKSIPWDGFARSGLITQEEGDILTKVEKLNVAGNKATDIGEDLQLVATTIFKVLGEKNLPVERNDVKKFNLVALSDLLKYDEFLNVLKENHLIETGLASLIKHVEDPNEIIKILAIYDSVSLLIQVDSPSTKFVDVLLDELIKLIDSGNFNLKFLSLNLIVELLIANQKHYRDLIWKRHESLLPNLFQNLSSTFINNGQLSTNDSIQYQYKSLLIIWILSFDPKSPVTFNQFYLTDLLSLLKLLKISIKEKIIRLIISIFINLSSSNVSSASSLEIVKFLILNGDFISILNNLKERKWTDDELVEDLNQLLDISSTIFNKLTSFDEYLQELNLKNFKNSPVHFKEEFFIDNLGKFQESNFKIFKKLLSLLDDDKQESLSLKILLSDLEKLIKIDSSFITVLIKEDRKQQIMELLNHKNSDVRYQALKITQFLVSQSLK